jgi:hypothetical protein
MNADYQRDAPILGFVPQVKPKIVQMPFKISVHLSLSAVADLLLR